MIVHSTIESRQFVACDAINKLSHIQIFLKEQFIVFGCINSYSLATKAMSCLRQMNKGLAKGI